MTNSNYRSEFLFDSGFELGILGLLALIASLCIMGVLTPLANKLKLLDIPDHRKKHDSAVPLVGGLAIYLVLISAVLVIEMPEKLNWIIFASSFLVALGAVDDAIGLGVRFRLLVQIFASLLMILGADLWIRRIGLEAVNIDSLAFPWGIFVTLICVVGLTNAFNMIDGIDGLSSGQVLISLACLSGIIYFERGEVVHFSWLVLLMSAVFAFWLVNLSLTPLRRVFLGDAGSVTLGFIVAFCLIYYTQDPISAVHPVVAIWCVTFPVLDALTVIFGRLYDKRSPFFPDRRHLHYLLIDKGLSPKFALGCILIGSVLVNVIGIWITTKGSSLLGFIIFTVLILIAGLSLIYRYGQDRVADVE